MSDGEAVAESTGSVSKKSDQADLGFLPSESPEHTEDTASFKLLSAEDPEGVSKEALQATFSL